MADNSAVEGGYSGGYDYVFVDSPPDRLVCKICQSVCREPQLTECCGHVYCKCCLNKFKHSTIVSQACPMCRAEPFNTFPHREGDREIRALQVYCPNMKDGCGWIGELANIVGHKPLQKCERCDKCGDIIHYSDNHLPTNCPCYCPHCDTTADREVICSEHKEKCHKFPIRCPNNCGQHIPRDNMDDHKKVCPLEIIQCKYQCGARIARNEVAKHNQEKMTEHIQWAYNVLNKLHIGQTARSVELPKADQVDHNITLASPIRSHLTTTVLCVIIAIITALLLQSYYTTTDHDPDDILNHITKLHEKINNKEITTKIM